MSARVAMCPMAPAGQPRLIPGPPITGLDRYGDSAAAAAAAAAAATAATSLELIKTGGYNY